MVVSSDTTAQNSTKRQGRLGSGRLGYLHLCPAHIRACLPTREMAKETVQVGNISLQDIGNWRRPHAKRNHQPLHEPFVCKNRRLHECLFATGPCIPLCPVCCGLFLKDDAVDASWARFPPGSSADNGYQPAGSSLRPCAPSLASRSAMEEEEKTEGSCAESEFPVRC